MRRLPWIHIILFSLTLLSTLAAGAMQQGINPLAEPLRLYKGLPFSLTLMLILLAHELSHYFASISHRVKATLPYFIPAPSIIGTFGAFIKMKSPIFTRRALVDIGASGPIVGFLISVVAVSVGLALSEVVMEAEAVGGLRLGESILFSLLAKVMLEVPPEGAAIVLHPVAFAGWIGLFVTSLNLLPIGQLDGGHISYALLGGFHRTLSMVLVFVLAVLGVFAWVGWAVWAGLMLVLGVTHPPVMYWETPLDKTRRVSGWACLVILILTFTPVPFIILA